MKVRVLKGARFGDGQIHWPGEVLELPSGAERRWIAGGYVEPIAPEESDLGASEDEGESGPARDTTLSGTRDTLIRPERPPRFLPRRRR